MERDAKKLALFCQSAYSETHHSVVTTVLLKCEVSSLVGRWRWHTLQVVEGVNFKHVQVYITAFCFSESETDLSLMCLWVYITHSHEECLCHIVGIGWTGTLDPAIMLIYDAKSESIHKMFAFFFGIGPSAECAHNPIFCNDLFDLCSSAVFQHLWCQHSFSAYCARQRRTVCRGSICCGLKLWKVWKLIKAY